MLRQRPTALFQDVPGNRATLPYILPNATFSATVADFLQMRDPVPARPSAAPRRLKRTCSIGPTRHHPGWSVKT